MEQAALDLLDAAGGRGGVRSAARRDPKHTRFGCPDLRLTSVNSVITLVITFGGFS